MENAETEDQEFYAAMDEEQFGIVEKPAELFSRKLNLPAMPRCSSFDENTVRYKTKKIDRAYVYFKIDLEIDREYFPLCEHTDLVAGGVAPVAQCRFICYFKNLLPLKKKRKTKQKLQKFAKLRSCRKNIFINCKQMFLKAVEFLHIAKMHTIMSSDYKDGECLEEWDVTDVALDALAGGNMLNITT